MTSGFSAPWADQEWKTYWRSRLAVRSPSAGSRLVLMSRFLSVELSGVVFVIMHRKHFSIVSFSELVDNVGDFDIDDPSPRSIAAAIARQINSGTLAPGERLPTVRDLARQLGVSPATVSHAWQALSGAGLIVSRGRSGSFVQSRAANWLPRSMRRLAGHMPPSGLDLSRGTPNPALLPD